MKRPVKIRRTHWACAAGSACSRQRHRRSRRHVPFLRHEANGGNSQTRYRRGYSTVYGGESVCVFFSGAAASIKHARIRQNCSERTNTTALNFTLALQPYSGCWGREGGLCCIATALRGLGCQCRLD